MGVRPPRDPTVLLPQAQHETIGDAYITASNLQRRERNKGTVSALSTAVTLIQVVRDLEFLMEDGTTVTMEARVGLHTGDVAAGVVGQKRKLMSLVGDTMVSRAEGSAGGQQAGRVLAGQRESVSPRPNILIDSSQRFWQRARSSGGFSDWGSPLPSNLL